MTPSDEYRDPLVEEFLAKNPPPAHSEDFWSDLDATLAAEPVPGDRAAQHPDPLSVEPVVVPLVPLGTSPESNVGLGEPQPLTQPSVVPLTRRRADRTALIAVVAAAAALLVVVGVFQLRSEPNVEIADTEALPGTDAQQQVESPTGEFLAPGVGQLVSDAGLATLDGQSDYLWLGDEAAAGQCRPKTLAIREAGGDELRPVSEVRFQGDMRLGRLLTGELAVLEICADTGNRLYVGPEDPAGGFAEEPRVVPVATDFDTTQAVIFDVVVSNDARTQSIDPHTGAVVRVADCSGVRVPAKDLRGEVPPEVAFTRARLAQAAKVCDYDRLRAMVGPEFSTAESEDPMGDLAALEAANEDPMAGLVGVLNTTAVFVTDPIDPEFGEVYAWPRAIIFRCPELPDEFRDELFVEVGYNQRLLDDDCDRRGSYGGWRLSITPEGAWRAFSKG